MFKKDSVIGTLIVVVLVSLVCSVIVAGSAVSLKPRQQEQKVLDIQKNILKVAGLLQPNTDIKKAFAENIETRYWDFTTQTFVAPPKGFDAQKFAKDPQTSEAVAAEDDVAKIRRRPNIVELYWVKDGNGELQQVILPIYGTGLWSVMYGFISLAPDANTIKGITYYQQGETAGLGGEIANPLWQQNFVGKTLFDGNDHLVLHVSKGGNADKAHGIDALSGATLTSNGVQKTFDYWFGKQGFAPFLAKLKSGEIK